MQVIAVVGRAYRVEVNTDDSEKACAQVEAMGVGGILAAGEPMAIYAIQTMCQGYEGGRCSVSEEPEDA